MMEQIYLLQGLNAPCAGACFAVNRNLVIGRDQGADILVADDTVSRQHCSIQRSGTGFVAEDLGSQNGIYINRKQSRKHSLKPGDILTVGRVSFLFICDESDIAAVVAEPTRQFQLDQESVTADMLGDSQAFSECLRIVHRYATTRLPVLIQGETGTGKGLLAKWIHRLRGERGAFVAVNCPCIPENLFESELFGVAAGAYTGADITRPGLIEHAGNGTLFLDELGELPLGMQSKLLRVLEDGVYRKVGSGKEQQAQCRIVAATNRDLLQATESGQFRLDLYHRLATLIVRAPALHERGNDVLLMADHFAERMAHRIGKAAPDISPRVQEQLLAYKWPGNIRELRNVIERAVVLCDSTLELHELEDGLGDPCDSLADVEKTAIRSALSRCCDNITHAAKMLGISRPTLRRKIQLHGLK